MSNLVSRDLSALLGATRAAVLEAIADGGSTTEVALRLGVSPSSASEHAAVLRRAGLVISVRARNQVRHHLTPLGIALLGLEVPDQRTFDPRAQRARDLPAQRAAGDTMTALARHPAVRRPADSRAPWPARPPRTL
ncbi:ArsR/SmtB family transcription factor [Nocardia huaxiensis]|uniref:Winged helix-turn-helix transcriptional regulator n=1 Tax=Nocardia huaxiensis TaxID=2755382 RepID=A0A7D6VL23_9NOCA|nr:winged helix-turn-helix domain-containing protein [Nocardia huaxiensis]QLY32276.1 winged helix-turn-helix transcriptional regulator [Nocardia huaxiensis]UFS94020.1 winged helix-turn-helix domain-containing protein [Nocardia huaxiensis]